MRKAAIVGGAAALALVSAAVVFLALRSRSADRGGELSATAGTGGASEIEALRREVGTPPRRVLVVGWDGADWELLEGLIARGTMPNLARLRAAGSYGELAAFTPLLSPLIWTTIATGVPPEEHGVLDFVEVEPDGGATVPVTGRRRAVPAIWNAASALGMSVAVVGWWATWPAERVNGVAVSDRLFFLLSNTVAGAPAGTVVFPPADEPAYTELARRADEESGERAVTALLPVSSGAYARARRAGKGMADPIDGYRRILVGSRTYLEAALRALASRPALTMVYDIGTDEVGHLLAPHLPPALEGADPTFAESARVGVERYFTLVDGYLGRLMERCPLAECAVVIVSDHGFKWGKDRPRRFSGVAAATAALWHRPNGVFVIAGNGVDARGRAARPASVYDVAPTIAALLGMPAGVTWRGTPLPGAPDGRVPKADWAALVPPASYKQGGEAGGPSAVAIAQLKALGYLEETEGGAGQGTATEGELNNLGLLHLESKRYAEAERAFQNAIRRNPAYASPHYNLRRLYFETGRFGDADGALWAAVDRGLRDAEGAVGRAITDYQRHGHGERAASLLAEATSRFPDNEGFAARQLGLLVSTGRCAEGVGAGVKATQRFGRSAPMWAFYGLAAGCAGDAATARRALARSLELDPNQPEIRTALEAL